MNRTERNFWLDLAIFAALLLTILTGLTLWLVIPHTWDVLFLGFARRGWAAAHIGFGGLGLAEIVLHIVWHRGWLKALGGRPLTGMPGKLRANRVVNRVMWITYIAANGFGVLAWALQPGDGSYRVSLPDRLHVGFGVAGTLLMLVHLGLHWQWISSAARVLRRTR